MSRPLQRWFGFTSPHRRPRHVHPPQHDPHPHPHPGAPMPWGYPGLSHESLVTVLGDETAAHTARLLLDRAPDEMRVIADLLIRLQLDQRAGADQGRRAPGAEDATTS
jgi:hypothetical protein